MDVPADLSVGRVTPSRETCSCVRKRDLQYNLERGWKGLWKAQAIPETSLTGWEKDNLFITSRVSLFKRHLRHIALRQPVRWVFQVSSDADLMSAWLSNVTSKGGQVNDPDAILSELPPMTLDELIDPPELLIILLGIKKARNVAAPEVLHEALHQRMFRDRPTWLVDQPYERLEKGHIAWSPAVDDYLSEWDYMDLEKDG